MVTTTVRCGGITKATRSKVCRNRDVEPARAAYCFGRPSPYSWRVRDLSRTPSPPASTIAQRSPSSRRIGWLDSSGSVHVNSDSRMGTYLPVNAMVAQVRVDGGRDGKQAAATSLCDGPRHYFPGNSKKSNDTTLTR